MHLEHKGHGEAQLWAPWLLVTSLVCSSQQGFSAAESLLSEDGPNWGIADAARPIAMETQDAV